MGASLAPSTVGRTQPSLAPCGTIGWEARLRPEGRRRQLAFAIERGSRRSRAATAAEPFPVAAISTCAAPSWSATEPTAWQMAALAAMQVAQGRSRGRQARCPCSFPWGHSVGRALARTEPARASPRALSPQAGPGGTRKLAASTPRPIGATIRPHRGALSFGSPVRGAAPRFRSCCGRTTHARQAQERRRL